MKIKRVIEVDTKNYQTGDVISFELKDGEKVQALMVDQSEAATTFCLLDCIKKEYPMNSKNINKGGYEASDLRKALNSEILDRFPDELREKMVSFDNGDYLRIPTEKEIFGKSRYGKDEPEDIQQWQSMKLRRNRIAFEGLNGEWEWYWLQNSAVASSAYFANCNDSGVANYGIASNALGVRPVFKIRNL